MATNCDWIATSAMREELACVLAYAQLSAYMARHTVSPAQVLDQFDACIRVVTAPARSAPRCSDPDDQKFIDLAVHQQATLLSRDKAILRLKRRLAGVGVQTLSVQEFVA